MKNTTPLAFSLLAAMTLCLCPDAYAGDHGDHHTDTSRKSAEPPAKGDSDRAKDNTGLNKRDRAEDAATAGKQKNNKSDVSITADIRRAITKDKSLSTNARNVKVITRDGKVTLKGPVANAEQKKAVEDKAEEIVGAGMVTSELEIKQ